jgi:hypothetical protein
MHKIINFSAFQTAWFAAVLGAANGMPWLGVIAVPLALGLHLAMSPSWRQELLLALCAAIMGFIIDSVLIALGAFSPVPFLFPSPFSSLWMVMLWVNLATTMNVTLSWLHGRYALCAVFGAVGGPMAYYSGARLGAMTNLPPLMSLFVIGLAWAVALPLLYRMSKTIGGHFSKD